MEIWDAYDENFNVVKGKTLIRGKPIPPNFFHLVCDILVRHTDGTYLLMQRHKEKKFGGMWEASAGGSALRGETPKQCAKRELFEETGILADELTELGRIVHYRRRTLFVEFLCITDCDKEKIVLQEGETQNFKWVDGSEILNMPKNELASYRIQNFIETLD